MEETGSHSSLKDKEEARGSCRPVTCTSTPVKVVEQLIWDDISRHLKDKKLLGSSQSGFTRGSLQCGDWPSGRGQSRGSFDFSEAFSTVFHSTFMDKWMKYRLDKLTVMWAENWLSGRAQRAGFTGIESSWRLVNSGVPQG
ncbi:uncharacterized protein ACIB01_008158 [Guaruba guarouba]